LQSGWQISVTTTIDYTASNGTIQNRNSLHFFDGQRPNEYMQAIGNVGNIIAPYDHSGMFPLYGFGAQPQFIPGVNDKHFCFPLNGDFANPQVQGV
jgi:hypothetical protein